MGQSAHRGRRAAVSARSRSSLTALPVAVALVGAGLTGCSSSVASLATTLRGVADVTVVHPDGSAVPAVDGQRLHAADVVRTGAGGRAELVTGDRVVYLGSQAALQVADGAHQLLRKGAVVVDAQHGPSVDLDVAGLSVQVAKGAAVRAERSVTVRVGTLAAAEPVTVVSSAGRRLSVPALYQAISGGDALPDTPTPLRLTDDDGEAHAVPDLVRDDRALDAMARGIDATGRATARVVQSSWNGPLAAPAGTGRSERLLPAVIATATRGRDLHTSYEEAVAFRRQGGSWGVVARLVGVRAAGVATALAAFERTQPRGHIGSVRQVLSAAAGTGNGGTTTSGGNPGGGGGGNPGGGGPGGGGGTPSPTPTPSPSGGSDLVGTVGDTVGGVLALLPSPSPTPSGASTTPAPLLTLPSLPLGR